MKVTLYFSVRIVLEVNIKQKHSCRFVTTFHARTLIAGMMSSVFETLPRRSGKAMIEFEDELEEE